MGKIDEVLSKVNEIQVEVAKIQTEIKILPELHTKVDDLCNRVTKTETRDNLTESNDLKKIKRYALIFSAVGIGLTVYNSIVGLFT